MTVQEAYKIAKTKSDRFVAYGKLDNYYIFCIGDSNYWYGVEKDTGEIKEFFYSEMLGEQAIFGNIDDEFFDRFSKAIKIASPISDLE